MNPDASFIWNKFSGRFFTCILAKDELSLILCL